MDIRMERLGDLRIAYVTGDMNPDNEARFRDALDDLVAGPGGGTAVDLSGLKTINSNGLSALIHLVTRSRLAGGQVFLIHPTPFVRQVMEITRLDRLFDICASVDEVRARLQPT